MKTTLVFVLSALMASVTLLPSRAQAQISARDEPLAKQFIYCAVVAQYWLERMTRPEAPADSQRYADSTRQQRDLFYIAAAITSDGEFIQRERTAAVAKATQELEGKMASGEAHPMMAEAKACAELFTSQAAPLLNARSSNK